jgi:hypothetical protein
MIPIPFPRKNPIPDSRKIHDCIHSRYQVGSRWHFSHLTCSSKLFHHVLSMLLVNKQGNLSLTNKSSNYSLTDQSIKLAIDGWYCISKQCNCHEQSGRSQPIRNVKYSITKKADNKIDCKFYSSQFFINCM